MGRGIDYGMGETNIDRTTGIRFGVISQNDVLQAWADSSEPDYGEPTCGCCGDEPLGWGLDDGEYVAMADQHGEIMILRSPYYTKAGFCSPCVPGACHLSEPCNDGEKAYCFGHDWFDDGVAPYPVYSVETGKEVSP